MKLTDINSLLEKEIAKAPKTSPKCEECDRPMELNPFSVEEPVWECPHCGVGLKAKEKNKVKLDEANSGQDRWDAAIKIVAKETNVSFEKADKEMNDFWDDKTNGDKGYFDGMTAQQIADEYLN